MKNVFGRLFVGKTQDSRVQFSRYFFSGGMAFAVYFALLFVFTEYGRLYHMTSLVIAYLFSIAVNFTISKYFVFSNHEQKFHRQFLKFFVVAMIGLCLQYIIVSAFTGILALQYLVANVIASALVYVVSFCLNRLFTFRSKP